MLILQVLRWLLLLAEMLIAISVVYLCILTTAAIIKSVKWRGENKEASTDDEAAKHTFAILVPAHNEEVLLPGLLESLAALEYPKDNYAVYVVADNCTDTTAQVARETGWVHVFERFDNDQRSKGHALRWLMQRLEEQHVIHDAYIIIDADSVVTENFLQAMSRELARGAHALQADSAVSNAYESPSTIIRQIAMSLFYHIRAIGRNVIGGSSTLNGNGMCFSRTLLECYPWQAYSLSEDYEYYLHLVKHGERVHYVPDAIVRSYMPTSFIQMRTQDIRWESRAGNPSSRKTIGDLLRAAVRLRSFACIDAIIELVVPPLSLLVSCLFLTLMASLLLRLSIALLVDLLLFGGVFYYVGTGICMLRLPKAAYKVFLYVPGFILWKLWVVLVLARSKKYTSRWVRTSRPVL